MQSGRTHKLLTRQRPALPVTYPSAKKRVSVTDNTSREFSHLGSRNWTSKPEFLQGSKTGEEIPVVTPEDST